jgi:hypothetical protein
MKKTLLSLLSVSLLGCSQTVMEKCESHGVKTLKSFCLAERTGDLKYCDEVKDHLFKTTCKARVERRERLCYEIEDMRQRQWCLTMLY